MQEVKVLSTDAQPAVYAQWLHAPGAPTVLIYGHFGAAQHDCISISGFATLPGHACARWLTRSLSTRRAAGGSTGPVEDTAL